MLLDILMLIIVQYRSDAQFNAKGVGYMQISPRGVIFGFFLMMAVGFLWGSEMPGYEEISQNKWPPILGSTLVVVVMVTGLAPRLFGRYYKWLDRYFHSDLSGNNMSNHDFCRRDWGKDHDGVDQRRRLR